MSAPFWTGIGLLTGSAALVLWLRKRYLDIDHPTATPQPGQGLSWPCPVPGCREVIRYSRPSQRMPAIIHHVEYLCEYAQESA